jgi:hypothetical protein
MKVPVYILLICAAILMTAAVSTASYSFDGFPVVTRTSGTVNGGVYTGYEPWAGTTTLTGSFVCTQVSGAAQRIMRAG